jgi:NAD(P)-dependent dehydrogenase (short-subunit alcohol dehydrogenase family)
VRESLDGKVASVTGAATGIGNAIATALAADSGRVVVNLLNTPDLAPAVVARITEPGGEAIAVAADVGKRADYPTLVDATIERFGRWDILVNNAGIALVKPFDEVTDEEFDTGLPRERERLLHRLPTRLRPDERRRPGSSTSRARPPD